jgi:hypothetical protein
MRSGAGARMTQPYTVEVRSGLTITVDINITNDKGNTEMFAKYQMKPGVQYETLAYQVAEEVRTTLLNHHTQFHAIEQNGN